MINTSNFIIELLTITGKISGRKKIQKITYILQELGVPINEYFKYHLYGPYSANLQLKIDDMVDKKSLIEIPESESNGAGYIYSINPNNKSISASNITIMSMYRDLIIYLNKQSSVILEIIATIFFLLNQNYESINENVIREKIANLKPSLANKLDESFSVFKNIVKMKSNLSANEKLFLSEDR